jgi:DNA-binding response OmpR family regulator
VSLADEFRPQVALLDIGMPRMDGYETARVLRQSHGGDIVLIALTGWGQDEDKARALDAGFDHHLTKPADPDVLHRLIAAVVRA